MKETECIFNRLQWNGETYMMHFYSELILYGCSSICRKKIWLHQFKCSPILVTECWNFSWSWCTGSRPTGDFLSQSPGIGCHYSPPGLQSPSQPKNITVLQQVQLVPSYTKSPVLSYTAWLQRHIGVNNLPQLLCSFVRWEFNPRPIDHNSNALPLCHCATYQLG